MQGHPTRQLLRIEQGTVWLKSEKQVNAIKTLFSVAGKTSVYMQIYFMIEGSRCFRYFADEAQTTRIRKVKLHYL